MPLSQKLVARQWWCYWFFFSICDNHLYAICVEKLTGLWGKTNHHTVVI